MPDNENDYQVLLRSILALRLYIGPDVIERLITYIDAACEEAWQTGFGQGVQAAHDQQA